MTRIREIIILIRYRTSLGVVAQATFTGLSEACAEAIISGIVGLFPNGLAVTESQIYGYRLLIGGYPDSDRCAVSRASPTVAPSATISTILSEDPV